MRRPELPEPTAGLSEADARGCRWIEGEPPPLHVGMFCCRLTLPGESWCSRHRAICYRRADRAPRQRIAAAESGLAGAMP